MTTTTYLPRVNGQPAEPGCYVEGHWGRYGPDHLADHLADQASAFGWAPAEAMDDPREIRKIIDLIETWGYDTPGLIGSFWELHSESADAIVEWLNDRTGPAYGGMVLNPDAPGFIELPERNYVWHWRDGEFFLSPICEDGDCDDDTCAHHD